MVKLSADGFEVHHALGNVDDGEEKESRERQPPYDLRDHVRGVDEALHAFQLVKIAPQDALAA